MKPTLNSAQVCPLPPSALCYLFLMQQFLCGLGNPLEGAHTGAPVAMLLQRTQNIQADTVIYSSPSPQQSRSSKFLLPLYSSEKITSHQKASDCGRGAGRRENGMTQGRAATQRKRNASSYTGGGRDRQCTLHSRPTATGRQEVSSEAEQGETLMVKLCWSPARKLL